MTSTSQDELAQRLDSVRRKADQQCTAHAYLRDRYRLLQSAITTLSLVSGVTLLAVVMASPTLVTQTTGLSAGQYQWLTAFLAAFSFSIVVVLLAWRFDVRAGLHDQAVRHYTRSHYHASRLRAESTPLSLDAVERLEDEYLDDRDLPRIPEKKFLWLKQWHLQKVAISKRLDRDPFTPLRSIREELKSAPSSTSPNPSPTTADQPSSGTTPPSDGSSSRQ